MVDRRFWIADGRQVEFEVVFGLGGIWARLLAEAKGYLLTEVWCESQEPGQYRVRDFWGWHRDFENFRAQLQSRFEDFETWIVASGLIEKEQFVGAYYEKDSGGDDLVPS